jgi:hypothetical protein
MRKTATKEKNKNLRLGYYFGLIVIFIIIVSFTFKIFDIFKKSKFDGNNFFTVAIIKDKNTDLISVSPKEGTLKKLTITGTKNEESLKEEGIPFDALATSKTEYSGGVKSYFTKILLHKEGFKSNLTIFDLLRLSFYTQKISNDKISEDSIVFNDKNSSQKVTDWFTDPEIANENINIEVTNATQTSGLGNKVAKIITDMGGNVVLVNNSQNTEKKSKIYYKKDSYTAKKISKLLGIPLEKKEINAISEIVIQIGKDREDY